MIIAQQMGFFFFGLEIKGYLMKHENHMKLKLQYP